MPDLDSDSNPELAAFGEELRREREIRGISLKEISDSTKISRRFLEAIERNDHKTLPAPVFTRGFVREYARHLGLNAEEIVGRYNAAIAGDERDKPPHIEQLAPPLPPTRDKIKIERGIPPAYARVDRNVYILVIIVAALVGVTWWASQRAHGEMRLDETKAEALAITARHETAPPQQKPAAAVPAVTASIPPPVAPAGPVNDDILRLTVEVIDNSWVTLDIDGKTVFSDELKRGERKTFEAKSRIRFRTIGNAAGVSLTINDLRIPPLGRDGQVLHDRVYDRESLRKMTQAGNNNNT
ncbi:MAG TPA: RodZ domain-containing protein [Thermoanaerobaculia bacterium]|nr:RodZ domain-containing protein [Thermoanaerobaculia bacterium]